MHDGYPLAILHLAILIASVHLSRSPRVLHVSHPLLGCPAEPLRDRRFEVHVHGTGWLYALELCVQLARRGHYSLQDMLLGFIRVRTGAWALSPTRDHASSISNSLARWRKEFCTLSLNHVGVQFGDLRTQLSDEAEAVLLVGSANALLSQVDLTLVAL